MLTIDNIDISDIGRAVYYNAGSPNAPDELGIITSYNHLNIFVDFKKFGTGPGVACTPGTLRWASIPHRECQTCGVQTIVGHHCAVCVDKALRNMTPEDWDTALCAISTEFLRKGSEDGVV